MVDRIPTAGLTVLLVLMSETQRAVDPRSNIAALRWRAGSSRCVRTAVLGPRWTGAPQSRDAKGIFADSYAGTSRTDMGHRAWIGIGGGGGTSIVTAGMRGLPYGLPKIMVSTLAPGDVAPYVGIYQTSSMMPLGHRFRGAQPVEPPYPAQCCPGHVGTWVRTPYREAGRSEEPWPDNV